MKKFTVKYMSYSKPSSHGRTFLRILDPEILTFWGLWPLLFYSWGVSCRSSVARLMIARCRAVTQHHMPHTEAKYMTRAESQRSKEAEEVTRDVKPAKTVVRRDCQKIRVLGWEQLAVAGNVGKNIFENGIVNCNSSTRSERHKTTRWTKQHLCQQFQQDYYGSLTSIAPNI